MAPPQRPTRSVRPATGKQPMRASTVGGKAPTRSMARPTTRSLPPRAAGSKNKTLLLIGGGVGLLLIVGGVFAMNSGGGGGGKKGNKDKDKGTSTQNTDSSGTNTSGVVDNTPPDIRTSDLPQSPDVQKLRDELKGRMEKYPADLTALSDADLDALIADWHAFVDKARGSDFSGHNPKVQRTLMNEIQGPWQKAREEKEKRDDVKKRGGTNP